MAVWIPEAIDRVQSLAEDWIRPSNLDLIVPAVWLLSLGPLLAEWWSQGRGRISRRTFVAIEIVWLSLVVVGTAVAWWFWFVDYRRRISTGVAGQAGVSAYLTLVFMATLTITAITRWRRGETLLVRSFLKAVAVAAALALSFTIIMVLVGAIVFFAWGPWPDDVVTLTFLGIGIAIHGLAAAVCWRLISPKGKCQISSSRRLLPEPRQQVR